MKRWIAVLAAAFVVGLSAPAVAWDLDKMNQTINETNFILDNVCSATLISVKEKLVLTNYHCIDSKITAEDREELQPDGTIKKLRRFKYDDVSLTQKSYKDAALVGSAEYMAEIVAQNKRADLALLRIKADSIPHSVYSPILPADKTVRRGQRVYIVGNPAMLDASVVEGVISSVNRVFNVEWAEGEKVPFYQIAGGLTGGNSGGALYTDEGYLIGVPAAGFRQEFLGLAIQLGAIKSFLKANCYASVYEEMSPNVNDVKCIADKKAKAEKFVNGGNGEKKRHE